MNHKIQTLNLLIFFLLFQSNALAQLDDKPSRGTERIVATVNGDPIHYEVIRIDDGMALQVFKAKYNRQPTPEELDAEIHQMEMGGLAGEIHDHIHDKAISAVGITATKQEARSYFQKIYPGIAEDPDGTLKRQRRYFQQLALALREALREPGKEREIYESRLKDLVLYETWKEMVKYHDANPQKIELIERNIPQSVEDIYESSELSMISMVIENKLNDWIAKDIKVSNEELKAYYESEYRDTGTDFEALRPKLEEALLNKKRDSAIASWWQEQYKKADIEIKDDRFKKVLELLAHQETAQTER